MAHSYLPKLSSPALILMVGVTGTGKSTLASELARRWSMEHISSDLVRKRLAGIDAGERRYEPFLEGIYSPEFSALTYEALLEEAGKRLSLGHSVVLDATFRQSDERGRAVALAQALNADAWVVQCVLEEEEARREQRPPKFAVTA